MDLDAWERRLGRFVHVIAYAVLGVTTVLYLAFTQHSTAQKAVTLAIVAAGFVWISLRNVLPRPVFITGMVLFYAVLGLREHWFGAVSYAVYIYAAEYLRGKWMLVVTAVTAGFATLSIFGGYPPPEERLAFWGLLVLFVTVACVFTFIGYITTEQARTRKELLEENQGLHAQLLVQAREAGVLDERQRMAQEIHDTLAQGLTGIITQLEAASTGDWRARVATAARLARENLAEARRSVHALRPPALENADLPEALAEIVDGWSAASGVPVSVTTTGTARPMHPEVEVALLRTAQEALANVAKHASASRVGLTLSYMEDVVTLDVRDDGVGFDVSHPAAGFGLTTMRQRVQRLAGALAVESSVGDGTAVSASVPAVAP